MNEFRHKGELLSELCIILQHLIMLSEFMVSRDFVLNIAQNKSKFVKNTPCISYTVFNLMERIITHFIKKNNYKICYGDNAIFHDWLHKILDYNMTSKDSETLEQGRESCQESYDETYTSYSFANDSLLSNHKNEYELQNVSINSQNH